MYACIYVCLYTLLESKHSIYFNQTRKKTLQLGHCRCTQSRSTMVRVINVATGQPWQKRDKVLDKAEVGYMYIIRVFCFYFTISNHFIEGSY